MLIYEQKAPEPQFDVRGLMGCGMAGKPLEEEYLMRKRPRRGRFFCGT